MKKIIAFLISGIYMFSLVSCNQKNESKKIRIAYLPITHSLPLFEEKELLKEEGIDVELIRYGAWPELLDALNTGRVDGAVVLAPLAIKSKQQGIGIKAALLAHKDGNAVITSKNIDSVKELNGKTIAIPHRQSSHNILINEMLEKEGMSIKDVNIVEMAPTEMPSALATNRIDAYCVAEPFGAKAIIMNAGKVLYESNDIWKDSICCTLVFTDDFINNRSEDAKTFIKYYKEAGNKLDKEEGKRIAKEYLDIDENASDLSLQWISYNNLEIKKEDYNLLIDELKKYELSTNTPSYEEFVYVGG